MKKVSIQCIRLADVKASPIRRESFPPELSRRIEATYREIGHYQEPTLEQWELGFMRETNPENEVAVWEVLAKAFRSYRQKCWKGGRLKRREAQQIIAHLCMISMGQPLAILKADAVTKRQLYQCFLDAGGVPVLPIVLRA